MFLYRGYIFFAVLFNVQHTLSLAEVGKGDNPILSLGGKNNKEATSLNLY